MRLHRCSFEDSRFVEFAGDAPFCGEIDEDRVTLLKFGGEPFGSKFFPASTGSCRVGDRGRALKLIADEINPAADYEREHEHEDEESRQRGSNRRDEGAFHPASDTQDKEEGTRPDQGSNAALSAEH